MVDKLPFPVVLFTDEGELRAFATKYELEVHLMSQKLEIVSKERYTHYCHIDLPEEVEA